MLFDVLSPLVVIRQHFRLRFLMRCLLWRKYKRLHTSTLSKASEKTDQKQTRQIRRLFSATNPILQPIFPTSKPPNTSSSFPRCQHQFDKVYIAKFKIAFFCFLPNTSSVKGSTAFFSTQFRIFIDPRTTCSVSLECVRRQLDVLRHPVTK